MEWFVIGLLAVIFIFGAYRTVKVIFGKGRIFKDKGPVRVGRYAGGHPDICGHYPSCVIYSFWGKLHICKPAVFPIRLAFINIKDITDITVEDAPENESGTASVTVEWNDGKSGYSGYSTVFSVESQDANTVRDKLYACMGITTSEENKESAGKELTAQTENGAPDGSGVTGTAVGQVEPADTASPPEEEVNFTDAPYWSYRYIYSYNEIYNATEKQKQYYAFFKKKCMNDEFPDLKENTNYAFILIFDLLNEYDSNKDMDGLERRLKLISKHYSKTKSYAMSFLIKKMKESGYLERAEILSEEEYEYWKLGMKYRDLLQLSRDEVKSLNKLRYTSNKFNSISLCMIEIVMLYRAVMRGLKNKYEQDGRTLDNEVRVNTHYSVNNNEAFYSLIFRHCENAVREHYAYTPKLNINMFENRTAYRPDVAEFAVKLIPTLVHNFQPTDRNTEMLLNYHCPNRWTKLLKRVEKNCKDSSQFLNGLASLCLPENIPESTLYSAIQFILKRDTETAIKLYIYYLNSIICSSRTVTGDVLYPLIIDGEPNTQILLTQVCGMNVKIMELLNPEQLQTYKEVMAKFLRSKDLKGAISGVSEIYRRKIRIDSSRIEKIRQQHDESVAVLNEYLDDGTEDENRVNISSGDSGNVNSGSDDGISGELSPETGNTDITFSQIQADILAMFDGDYSVLQCDVEAFARSKGALKNQIIESINDICYEHLDDVLIEEDGDYYTVNSEYYKIIHAS
ncbi:MAG: hypothetical protein LBK97_07720 [Prevotellaceae bacterium]|jgi:hypothetical protein|nr:hypothetical protein [Prevotellaceae bacterium]